MTAFALQKELNLTISPGGVGRQYNACGASEPPVVTDRRLRSAPTSPSIFLLSLLLPFLLCSSLAAYLVEIHSDEVLSQNADTIEVHLLRSVTSFFADKMLGLVWLIPKRSSKTIQMQVCPTS